MLGCVIQNVRLKGYNNCTVPLLSVNKGRYSELDPHSLEGLTGTANLG